MKALVVAPGNASEFKFLSDLLKKPGLNSHVLNLEEVEHIGMSQLLKGLIKTKKASRAEIIRKLSA